MTISTKSIKNVENQKQQLSESDDGTQPNLKGDYGHIAFLVFLYLLQDIPFGISSAVPVLLQNMGATYAEQAWFSLVFYPFTMKILWAPFVDSVYIKNFGRRKSWLIPTQFLTGCFMVFISSNISEWFGDGSEHKPQIFVMVSAFFALCFLISVQDIAVDGWALTMVQPKNVGYIATCNAVGRTAGYVVGYVLFLVIESKDFCNKFIYSEESSEGLVTLPGFLKFWGIVFMCATILVAIFKKEKPENEEKLERSLGVKSAYPMLWKIMKLRPVLKFAIIAVTAKAFYIASDAVTSLKLIDYGLSKDTIALLSVPLIPVQVVFPFVISRFTSGPKPLNVFIKSFPYRIMTAVVIAVFVYFTPQMINGTVDGIPGFYFISIASLFIINQLPLLSINLAEMAFAAKIADPLIGGTYLTLMNTISAFGTQLMKTFYLWLVDVVTWKSCIHDDSLNSTMIAVNKCEDDAAMSQCLSSGGQCHVDVDGYYVEIAISAVFAIIWFPLAKRILRKLQNLPTEDWHVVSSGTDQNYETETLKPEIS